MEDTHRKVINRHRCLFRENVTITWEFLELFRDKARPVLSRDMSERIMNEHRNPTNGDKCREFLDIIVTRGPEAFDVLIDALVKIYADNVAKEYSLAKASKSIEKRINSESKNSIPRSLSSNTSLSASEFPYRFLVLCDDQDDEEVRQFSKEIAGKTGATGGHWKDIGGFGSKLEIIPELIKESFYVLLYFTAQTKYESEFHIFLSEAIYSSLIKERRLVPVYSPNKESVQRHIDIPQAINAVLSINSNVPGDMAKLETYIRQN